ncbi:tetratricopeptide repeat-containing sulfotransferase family protein [Pseudohalocynthiibacter sp. F2068]|jgi:tetratricopeptide (TPR) repeat protein|uniref:tetratricopeptide repeat protein n=1 Tax=Pseudohalocynthiibacter sp. F2068 TaxID=2926418 RepID=UPI001FF6E99C|nr:tetratricopeptide repeat-containing sulfotransferase family protein [Pseudohalocynthiibacter sp. F2068]MCK0103369.1 tetratricopeptide repeat protein [Pseudohalocynthiibacter sp. F2068]
MELTIDEALKKGIAAHRSGQVQEANKFYTAVLQSQPKHPGANHNMGILAVGVGKLQEALPFLKTALEANPSIAQYWLSYAAALVKLGRTVEAKGVLDQAKKRGAKGEAFAKLEQRLNQKIENDAGTTSDADNSRQSETNFLDTIELDQAISLAKQKAKEGSAAEAKSIYQDILDKFPDNKKALDGIKTLTGGVVRKGFNNQEPPQDQIQFLINLYSQGQLQQVLLVAMQMLEQYRNSATLYNVLGAANAGLRQFDAAIDSYKQALKIKPDYAEAYSNMGNALRNKGDIDSAIDSYKQALKIKPDYAEAYSNLGNALKNKGDLEAAIESYKQSLKLNPDYAEAYSNMGNAQQDKGDLGVAIDSYKQALKLKPRFAEAYYNMGKVLKEMGDLEAAIDSYKQALKIRPDYAEAHSNMGNALKDLGDPEAAIDSYKQALKVKPDLTEAYNNQCELFEKSNRLDEASQVIAEAKSIFSQMPGDLLFFEALIEFRSKDYEKCFQIIDSIEIDQIFDKRKPAFLKLKAQCFHERQDFKAAFSAFAQMNKLISESLDCKSQNPGVYFDKLADKVSQLKQSTTKPYVKNTFQATWPQPTFLVGFPRSGTTLLDTILRTHSKIDVVEEQPMVNKVKNHLNTASNIVDSENIKYDNVETASRVYFEELEKHLSSKNRPCVIDKLPLNIIEIPLIHQVFPNAKYILALRHPLDSILSCWMQNFRLNPPMANMVELGRIVDFYCLAMSVLEISEERYSLKVHRIRYEDLVNDLQLEVSNLLNFLDLDWEEGLTNYQTTALKRAQINTPSYAQVVQPLYKTASYRWKNYQEHLEKYFDKVEKWITKFGYDL